MRSSVSEPDMRQQNLADWFRRSIPFFTLNFEAHRDGNVVRVCMEAAFLYLVLFCLLLF